MDPNQEDAPPPADWAHDSDDDKGFWTRFKEAIAGAPAPEAPPAPPAPPPEPTTAEVKPRKIRRTAFDGGKKATSRRTRLRRAAEAKRESLALVVGAEVEKVIVEKIQPQEESLGRVAEGFGVLNEALTKIPESANAQVEVLGGQLTVLTGVRGELELHRAQRERVIDGLTRLEKAIADLSEKQKEQEKAVLEQAAADRRAQAEEAERFERNMAFFAARVHEQSSAILSAQEQNARSFGAAQRAVIEAFEDSQSRASAEAARREREQEEKAKARKVAKKRSRRLAGVAGALVLSLVGAAGFFAFSLDEQRASVARDAEERADQAFSFMKMKAAAAPVASSTTLPAGFVKER
ncbi:MAG TPA: hypothetical protein VFF73_38275 [Planctomycetota bacterium]|nr:hypothetical protein [Planctomycetota bacterium]